MPAKPAGDPTTWNVRHTHSTPTRMLWHKVAKLRANTATAVCGLEYVYPVYNVVFSDFTNDPPSYLKCTEGCY